ncbi:MAG TPA: transcriptional activator RfaH [Stellaceae bacterium]|nr:transcriptional activator RfaH [Stellaceae bacterium]
MNAPVILTTARAKLPRFEPLPSPPVALAEDERWYAVHTLPCNEARAEWHLGNQSFRTFMPKRRKTVRHARKLSTVEAPFFPRYLFVVLDLTRHQWRSVNGTYGVSRLVMRGDEPHPVPPGVVEALVASADANGVLQLDRHLQVGGPVRLLAGPFAEQLAVLEHLDDAGRVRVLLDIFGRKVAVSTGADNVLSLA